MNQWTKTKVQKSEFQIKSTKKSQIIPAFQSLQRKSNQEIEQKLLKIQKRGSQFKKTQFKLPKRMSKRNNNFNQPKLYDAYPLQVQEVKQDLPLIKKVPIDPQLVSVDQVIPSPFNQIFSSFSHFNKVQSKCFDKLFNYNQSMVISAPTASGKTTLFEIAIVRYLVNTLNSLYQSSTAPLSEVKIIYIAPIKALCQEKFISWRSKFQQSIPKGKNLHVCQITGDTSDDTNWAQVRRANIILTTPQKWQSMTRRWKQLPNPVCKVQLLLIDQVHLLGTEDRGATLEALVARMMLISRDCKLQLRIIALSATIPNISDLGKWLKVNEADGIKVFGEEYRPIAIQKQVLGFDPANNQFLFERKLNFKLANIIKRFSEGKPLLIFCQTQKGTTIAAQQIRTDFSQFQNLFTPLSYSQLRQLNEASIKLNDKNLKELVQNRIAFHNASLQPSDRRIIQQLYIKQIILIMCTTSTLAQGVNLPCRLVIIKSTVCYRGQGIGYQQYSPLEVQQMIGRAGRPQFDTKGLVVIMTQHGKVQRYKNIALNLHPVESHLTEKIVEHLNVEISLSTIKTLDQAVDWVKSTFFYIRMQKCQLQTRQQDRVKFEQKVKKMCQDMVKELLQYELIMIYTKKDGQLLSSNPSIQQLSSGIFRSTNLGKSVAKFEIAFETFKIIYKNHRNHKFLPPNTSKKNKQKLNQWRITGGLNFELLPPPLIINNSVQQILNSFSQAKQNSKFRPKFQERKLLNKLNESGDIVRYKVNGKVSTYQKKAMVLIQAALSWKSPDNWQLKREEKQLTSNAWRILMVLAQLFRHTKNGQGLRNCILLNKCIKQVLWPDSIFLLRQIPKIGEKLATQLSIMGGCKNFDSVLKIDDNTINSICGKVGAFAQQLKEYIKLITQYDIQYQILRKQKYNRMQSQSKIPFDLKLVATARMNFMQTQGSLSSKQRSQMKSTYKMILCNSQGQIVQERNCSGSIQKQENNYEPNLQTFHFSDLDANEAPYFIWMMNDKFVGVDSQIIIRREEICKRIGISKYVLKSPNQTRLNFQQQDIEIPDKIDTKDLEQFKYSMKKSPAIKSRGNQINYEEMDQLLLLQNFQSQLGPKANQQMDNKTASFYQDQLEADKLILQMNIPTQKSIDRQSNPNNSNSQISTLNNTPCGAKKVVKIVPKNNLQEMLAMPVRDEGLKVQNARKPNKILQRRTANKFYEKLISGHLTEKQNYNKMNPPTIQFDDLQDEKMDEYLLQNIDDNLQESQKTEFSFLQNIQSQLFDQTQTGQTKQEVQCEAKIQQDQSSKTQFNRSESQNNTKALNEIDLENIFEEFFRI